MAWCAFNEVPWFTRYGEICDSGGNYGDTGANGINLSDGLTNLEGGNGGRWSLVPMILFGREMNICGGEWSPFQFFCNTDIMRNVVVRGPARVWHGVRVRFGGHGVLYHLKTVGFGGNLVFSVKV